MLRMVAVRGNHACREDEGRERARPYCCWRLLAYFHSHHRALTESDDSPHDGCSHSQVACAGDGFLGGDVLGGRGEVSVQLSLGDACLGRVQVPCPVEPSRAVVP